MNAEDAKFIIQTSSDNGSSVVRAAMHNANPMWRVFFEQGWTQAIYKRIGERGAFLEELVSARDPEIACESVRWLFKGRTPKEVTSAMNCVSGDYNILAHWAYSGSQSEPLGKRADALLSVAAELGVDMDTQFKIKLKRGGSMQATALSKMVLDAAWMANTHVQAEEGAKLLLKHGSKVTDLVKEAILEDRDRERALRWIGFFAKHARVSASEILEASGMKRVNPDTVAYVSAVIARDAIDRSEQGKVNRLEL